MAREQADATRGQPRLVSVIGVDGDPRNVPNMLQLDSGAGWRGNEIVLGRTLAKDKNLHAATRCAERTTFSVVGVGTLRVLLVRPELRRVYDDRRCQRRRSQCVERIAIHTAADQLTAPG